LPDCNEALAHEFWAATLLLMKKILMFSALAMILGFSMAAERKSNPTNERKLQHVVAFKFKESVTAEQIKEVERAFSALQSRIPLIAAFEWGTNNSPEGHDKGFTHCFILTFNSEKDRDGYLPHPEHKKFGSLVGPLLADVFVIDFWAQE
jgi:hypothetical protein